MNVTTKITVDLTRPNMGTRVNAVQGDGNTRIVEVSLLSGGEAWEPPADAEAAIAYYQPGGAKGLYNLLAAVMSTLEEYREVIKNRAAWRARINELERPQEGENV